MSNGLEILLEIPCKSTQEHCASVLNPDHPRRYWCAKQRDACVPCGSLFLNTSVAASKVSSEPVKLGGYANLAVWLSEIPSACMFIWELSALARWNISGRAERQQGWTMETSASVFAPSGIVSTRDTPLRRTQQRQDQTDPSPLAWGGDLFRIVTTKKAVSRIYILVPLHYWHVSLLHHLYLAHFNLLPF